jgi:hypothetical protein
MPDASDKSIMRSLGEFVGHIVRGVKTPVDHPPARREVKREVEEETRETPAGKVTLRRTTIEEVEYHPDVDQTGPTGVSGSPGQE